MERKWPNISLINLKNNFSSGNWNDFLNTCYRNKDIASIKKALYGIQADMSDLAKQDLNPPEIVNLFLRLQRSLIETARKIIKVKIPSPLDNSGNNVLYQENLAQKMNRGKLSEIERAKMDFKKHSEIKRKRDIEFDLFIKESSF